MAENKRPEQKTETGLDTMLHVSGASWSHAGVGDGEGKKPLTTLHCHQCCVCCFQFSLVLFGTNPWFPLKTSNAPFVREFHVYIHKHEGYLNSFMLTNGKPHAVIPGFDNDLGVQKPQIFHYIIKYLQADLRQRLLILSLSFYLPRQRKIERVLDGHCNPDSVNDCIEDHLRHRLGDGCIIPWKSPGETRPRLMLKLA